MKHPLIDNCERSLRDFVKFNSSQKNYVTMASHAVLEITNIIVDKYIDKLCPDVGYVMKTPVAVLPSNVPEDKQYFVEARPRFLSTSLIMSWHVTGIDGLEELADDFFSEMTTELKANSQYQYHPYVLLYPRYGGKCERTGADICGFITRYGLYEKNK